MTKMMPILFCLLGVIVSVTSEPAACIKCQQSQKCTGPNCFCCRDELDLPFSKRQIPQIVFFTFDDAVTDQVAGFYRDLFEPGRKNPNGCPISMTLFISHDNTKYPLVSEFYKRGMEIASHSVTHNAMNGSNFFEEAKTQKENLAKLANIPASEITGWRSPYLKPAGDLQPNSLQRLGYKYDATLTFSKRSLRERPPSPFTLDFGWPYECQVKPCPKNSHAGFWEVPIVSLLDYKKKYDCVYVDGCMNAPPNENAAFKFLWDNFNSYYTTTRIPFGINMHPSWFFYPDRLKAMDRFIQELVKLPDVYVVSVQKTIEWLKQPTPLNQLGTFEPWSCSRRPANRNRSGRRRQRPAGWQPPRLVHPSLSPQWQTTQTKVQPSAPRHQPWYQTPPPVQQTSPRRQRVMERLEEMQRMVSEKQQQQQQSSRRSASTNQLSLTQMMQQRREQKRREELQRQMQLRELRRLEEYERQREIQLQRQHQERLKQQQAQIRKQALEQQRRLKLAKHETMQEQPHKQRLMAAAEQRLPGNDTERNRLVPHINNTSRPQRHRTIHQERAAQRHTAETVTYLNNSPRPWSQKNQHIIISKTVAPATKKAEPRTTTEDPIAKEKRLQEAHLKRRNETIERQRQQQAFIRQKQIADLRKQQAELQKQMTLDVQRQREQQRKEQRLLRKQANISTGQGHTKTAVNQTQSQGQTKSEPLSQRDAWRNFIRMILGSS